MAWWPARLTVCDLEGVCGRFRRDGSMTTTRSRIDALRAHLDETDPGWQDKLRAELDLLTPGWESFPLLIWDEETKSWVTIILLAKPESVSAPQPPSRIRSIFRRWFKRG
jgi:hypothetical protein